MTLLTVLALTRVVALAERPLPGRSRRPQPGDRGGHHRAHRLRRGGRRHRPVVGQRPRHRRPLADAGRRRCDDGCVAAGLRRLPHRLLRRSVPEHLLPEAHRGGRPRPPPAGWLGDGAHRDHLLRGAGRDHRHRLAAAVRGRPSGGSPRAHRGRRPRLLWRLRGGRRVGVLPRPQPVPHARPGPPVPGRRRRRGQSVDGDAGSPAPHRRAAGRRPRAAGRLPPGHRPAPHRPGHRRRRGPSAVAGRRPPAGRRRLRPEPASPSRTGADRSVRGGHGRRCRRPAGPDAGRHRRLGGARSARRPAQRGRHARRPRRRHRGGRDAVLLGPADDRPPRQERRAHRPAGAGRPRRRLARPRQARLRLVDRPAAARRRRPDASGPERRPAARLGLRADGPPPGRSFAPTAAQVCGVRVIWVLEDSQLVRRDLLVPVSTDC